MSRLTDLIRPGRRAVTVDLSRRRRLAVAGGIERLLAQGERGGLPARPVLVRPAVVDASRPALERIAATLRDEGRATPPGWAAEVDAFLTDGAGSPLYGRDVAAARAKADRLAAAA